MAYIGKQPTVGNFVKLDAIVTSATATYNLLNGGVAYSPQSPNHCIVSLNGVIQEPTSASNVGGFTISGSTIVFTSALTSSDVIDFILVLGDVLNIGTPSDATVGFSKVTSNLITGATAETSIAGGDSVLIYDDSASALRKMTRTNFVAGIGGTNTPTFFAYRTTDLTISHATHTKLALTSELFDTDSAYDNATNYRFTVPTGKGGKYYLHCHGLPRSAGSFDLYYAEIYLKKNGTSRLKDTYFYDSQTTRSMYTPLEVEVVASLSEGDYVEVFGYIEGYSNTGSPIFVSMTNGTSFMGYKLIE